jgi:hypothetical protein
MGIYKTAKWNASVFYAFINTEWIKDSDVEGKYSTQTTQEVTA